MPRDGSGNMTLLYDWRTRRDAGSPTNIIDADTMMAQEQDLADEIENSLPLNGSKAPTNNIPWGGYKLTGLGDATTTTDALNRRTGDKRYALYIGQSSGQIRISTSASAQSSINTKAYGRSFLNTSSAASARLLVDMPSLLCCGRLTLESGTPVSTTDQTAKTTLYFTPFSANKIWLYTGSAWQVFSFSELSISLSGYTANTNYDIFAYNNSGAVALESTAWSSATARATAITLQDGIYVKSGATTRRYLGTIRITGTTGQCEDSLSKRFVWNLYNRVIRRIRVVDNSTGWTYSTAAWRMANNNANNYVGVVIGVSLDPVYVKVRTRCSSSTATYRPVFVGIGLDAVTHSGDFGKVPMPVNSSASVPVEIEYTGFPGIGYHALNWCEYGAGTDTQTWDASGYDPGLSGWIVA